MSNLEDRVSNNLIYYRMNYLALYVCMLVIIAYILFFLYLCKECPLRSSLCSISVLHFFGCSLVSFCVTSSIPFVVVPRPFIIGDYRVTPSCIVLATAACRLCVEGFL